MRNILITRLNTCCTKVYMKVKNPDNGGIKAYFSWGGFCVLLLSYVILLSGNGDNKIRTPKTINLFSSDDFLN